MGIPSENDSLNVCFVHMPTVKSNFWTFISKKRALYGWFSTGKILKSSLLARRKMFHSFDYANGAYCA